MQKTDTADLKAMREADLRGRSVRGGVATLASQAVKLLLQLGSIAVLARLLRPEDFGMVAMVLAFTGFFSRFKDFGLSIAAVQRADITDAQQTGLFWTNVLIGSGLTLGVAMMSPVLAWLYAEPRLLFIGLAMALTFFVSGLGVQHTALLRRRLAFSSLAVVEIFAVLMSTGIGVAVAIGGAGYWALVAMPLTSACILSVGSWWLCEWRPGRFDRNVEIRSLIAFGGRLSLVSLCGSIARSVDVFLIGWRFGATSLGFYSKAIQLSMLFVEQMNVSVARVAIPVLSSLQNEPERFRGYYRRGMQLLGSVSVPVSVAFFVFANELTLLVLGPQWVEAASIFRLLAPAALFEGLRAATGWVYVSLGNARQQLRWAIFSASVRVVCILIGGMWGVEGVAVGYSVGVCSLWLPGVIYCFRTSPVMLSDLARVLWRPFAAALIAAAIALSGALTSIPNALEIASWLHVLFDLATFGAVYGITSLLLPGGFSAARDMLSLRRELKFGERRV